MMSLVWVCDFSECWLGGYGSVGCRCWCCGVDLVAPCFELVSFEYWF